MGVEQIKNRVEADTDSMLSEEEFRAQFSSLLAKGESASIQDHTFFALPSTAPPWTDTGIDLQAGVPVTVLAVGRTYLSQEHDIWVSPAFQLWYRIGESGEVFRGTRCSHTFTPDTAGRLFLAGYLPGEWATRTGGSAVPADAYQRVKGETSVLVIRWAGNPLDGLKRLAAEGDVANLLATEIDRLENPIPKPTGWEYLWFLGPSDSYTMSPNSRGSRTMGRTIGCYTHHDAAILQRDVSCEFTPDTSLRWMWKVDTLPSPQSEDSALTHDYMSIAVEFDNGQDLTYYWSVNLPLETVFRCPLPNWAARETHMVVRSGQEGLGQWLEEERNLYTDYQRAIGEPPSRIIRVWLIAVSLFQRLEGQCEYGAIEVVSGDRVLTVN